tara:strand:+ start:575 stop:2260 length:1686 start_codon:yes stop_codon:yes gene_type:complete
MATTIQIKRSTGTSAPGSLAAGELGVTFGTGTQSNLGDRLFIGDGSTVDVIGGKFFSDMLDHVQGTLTASSALTVDSNKAVDDLIVGNHASTGGSIELKEGTNNGTHHVQLKAPNALGADLALTLPGSDGNSGEVLKTNGSGTLSFGTLALSDATGTLALSALEIDGGTDIGADLVDADLFIVDDAAGGTNRKSELTRVKKYIFSALSGDATASNSGALTIASGAVENSMLAGSITNAKLTNSAVTVGSTSISLGATQTAIAGVTELAVDNINVNGNTIATTNTNGNLVLDPNGTGTIDVSNARITSLATPTQTTDAATKAYVDAQLQGLDVKNSVRVATTANGTLSSAFANGQTVDGITLATGDRILLKDQSTGSQNGIYTVNASGAPTRATDFDADSEVTGGTFFFVEEGTVNADNGFVMTNDGTVTVGSTALVFTQFSGAGQVTAGSALTKSGNTLNVAVDDSSIEVNSDALRVKASGITNAMLAGSIDLTAKVTGALPVGNGGTGLASIAKGSVLVANSANTLSALDGGGSNDGILTYTASSDTIAFATAVDGGTFS